MNSDPESVARSKVYDDIYNYARSKEGDELKRKYTPAEESSEADLSAGGLDNDELDQESLARLAAMAEE